MNQELWNNIEAFDFDYPTSVYGFSIRLANENFWTEKFTEQAILEYKKFMYLAATSEFMVSPSEIIDHVWHQHLIFTQSYQEFCVILGKQIQHIPSTHNRNDFEKFRQAKERTINYYERVFGAQPKKIWGYSNMFESLNLEKAKYKLRTFVVFGLVAFIFLTVPAYLLLEAIYIQIDNPYFILGMISIAVTVFLILEFYNKSKLKHIVADFDESSFIFNLKPYELVYLKTRNLFTVINGTLNELFESETIRVKGYSTIEYANKPNTVDKLQLQVASTLEELGKTNYIKLLSKLEMEPIFRIIKNSMDAFQKYFIKSKKFGRLFYLNFIILSLLVLLSFTRMVTGIFRDKPITLILLVTVALIIISIFFLLRLTKQISTATIPKLYRNDILPTMETANNWQWNYFIFGTAVLSTSFVSLGGARERDSKNDSGNNGNSCGSNSGSGCGSSCSSCGGCGGCGGG